MLATVSRIARNIIPDLAGRPLYVLPMTEGTPCAPSRGTWGLYHSQLAGAMREHLGERWQGPGVAVAVNVDAISDAYPDPDDCLRAVLGVVLHELTHWLAHGEPVESFTPAADFFRAREASRSAATPEESLPELFRLLVAHGTTFTRLASHLSYRCGHGGGMVLAPHWLAFAGDYPGLSGLASGRRSSILWAPSPRNTSIHRFARSWSWIAPIHSPVYGRRACVAWRSAHPQAA